MNDVAVVGIGLRFPGRADTAEGLWSVLTDAESQWSEFPADRLNIEGFYHPSRNRQGSIPFRGAHFLKRDVTKFDAPFFSITADEASAVDPQQRMLLEVTYEALENAGMPKERLERSSTSVFVGSFVKDYEQVCLRDPDDSPRYAATGNGIALMSNRISYFFNLRGPSETIDTGCSGSLVCIHNAIQSLQNNESSIAIAAGAGLILTPATMMPMTALNFLSTDGKCFTFDARANGYGRGEGIGVVILKRLSDALRDNDTIRAVIRGSSKNQDGRTLGITLPSSEAQAQNIDLAYASAGLGFGQTGYVECHGTGTQEGDWRELKAISETISKGQQHDTPLAVGSLKSNIGHLEGAAGIAGMIKGILVLEHGKIPPQANYDIPNTEVDLQAWNLKIPRSLLDWPLPGPRRVSVNCFGFGGSNVHLIMDDAANYMQSQQLKGQHNTKLKSASTDSPRMLDESAECSASSHAFWFSGPDKSALRRVLESNSKYLENTRDSGHEASFLRDYAYSLSCRRTSFQWRTHVVAKSRSSLATQITSLADSAFSRAAKPCEKICFAFGGQGAQWPRMGHDLMVFKVFRESLIAASVYMRDYLHSPFVLLDEILRDPGESIISRPEISQPATTAIQIALVDLLKSVGVMTTHVIGHSSGEIAAAYATESMSRATAWIVSYWRGFYAAAVSFLAPEAQGAMMVVGTGAVEVQQFVDEAPGSIQIACINSPTSVTLSGRRSHITTLSTDLTQRGIFHRILPVDVAYHSDFMKLVSTHYEKSIEGINVFPHSPGMRMFSTMTGEEIIGEELDDIYWAKNMVSQVRYAGALEAMMRLPAPDRPDVILEISPRSQLHSPTMDTLRSMQISSGISYVSVSGPRSLDLGSLHAALGRLWEQGASVNMLGILQNGREDPMPKCLVDLPPYPWNHSKSYWHESHMSTSIRFRAHGREDLIGALTPDSTPFEPKWRGFLRVFENPWLQDHKIQNTIIYPAAGMISMVLEAAKQISEGDARVVGFEITDMKIEKAIVVPESRHGVEIALSLRRSSLDLGVSSDAKDDFSIYSKLLGSPWQRHATGLLRVCLQCPSWRHRFRKYQQQYASAVEKCEQQVVPRQLYETLDNIGMNYGVTFRNIKELKRHDATCVSRIRIPDTRSKMPENFEFPHVLHPATLDSMFHSLFAIDSTPMVPVSVDRLFVTTNASEGSSRDFNGVSTAFRKGLVGASADIAMFRGQEPEAWVVVDGLELTRISFDDLEGTRFVSNSSHLCTEIVWKEDITFATPGSLDELLDLLSHKVPGLSILQFGADERLLTAVVDIIAPNARTTPRLSRYAFAKQAESRTLETCLAKMKDTGLEAFAEIVDPYAAELDGRFDLVLGLDYDSRSAIQFQRLLTRQGLLIHSGYYHGTQALSKAELEVTLNRYSELPVLENAESLNVTVLIPDKASAVLKELIKNLKSAVSSSLPHSGFTAATLQSLAQGVSGQVPHVVVSLLDVDVTNTFTAYDWDQNDFNLFHRLQATTKRMLWVTRGSHMRPLKPQGSPIIGLIRTLMSEDPLKRYITLDLSSKGSPKDEETAHVILSVLRTAFLAPIPTNSPEAEFAEQGGRIYIPRLVPIHDLNQSIEPDESDREYEDTLFQSLDDTKAAAEGLEHMPTLGPSSAEGSHFVTFEVPDLCETDIEIDFRSAALMNHDYDIVTGRHSRKTIGLDVTGCIRRVGSKVPPDFRVGEEVTGLTFGGSLKSVIHLDHRLSTMGPTNFIPSLYIAAYFALVHIGRARGGTRVLIQGAASAFGLAAVVLAQVLNLDIFSTISCNDANEQARLLQSLGLPSERIWDANSGHFEADLHEHSGDRGMDIVYNTSRSHVEVGTRCVRENGYVIQLGHASAIQKAPAQRDGITYTRFDIYSLLLRDPELALELFGNVLQLIHGHPHLIPLPAISATSWQIGEVDKALDYIAKSSNHGSALVQSRPEESQLVKVPKKSDIRPLKSVIDGAGTYLIVGGFLGLGYSIAELLINHGAKHVAFISRSGAATDSAKSALSLLQSGDTNVRAYSTDICDSKGLSLTVKLLRKHMPPIRGVFQCAAVISDAIFDNMTFSDWQAAVRPKTIGSLNLVESITAAGMNPFYVFLASSAGVIGNRGQANYAAGNSFEDAMARNLHIHGNQAVSIDLGPVLGAGMLADDGGILDMLRASGFHSISHADFLKVMEHAIIGEIAAGQPMPPQVVLGVGTGAIIRQNQPTDPYWTRTALYSYLNLIDVPPTGHANRDASEPTELKSMLARVTTPTAAGHIVAVGIRRVLATAMTMLPEEIDMDRPPNAYGVDSLVAIGLRNWVSGSCGVEVSLFEVLSDQSVTAMGCMIAKRGGYGGAVEEE